MQNKVISLSAISAALVAICLLVGTIFEIAEVFSLILASVFVILPLYFKSYKGCILCAVAGGVIALLLGLLARINSLIIPAYFTFFGIYPIVKCRFMDKKYNKIVCFIIGLVWCIAVAYICYFYYTALLGQVFSDIPLWLVDYVIYAVAVVAVIFYIIYDRFIPVVRSVMDKYLGKIIK